MKKTLIIIFLLLISANAFAVDTEVQDLTDITSPATGDDMYIVDDPDGTPASRKISVGALFAVSPDMDSSGVVTATNLTVSDNESTAETNAVLFTSAGDLDGGDLGIESDGDLNYNPSTGTLSSTEFSGGGGSLTGVDAATGDSATAFFSAGTIEHERGGLEADVSAYTGLVGINAGATSEVDTEGELETHLGGLDVVTVTAGDISEANLYTLLSDVTLFLEDVVDDTTPTLGGELDAGGNNIIDLSDVTFQTGASGGTLRTGTSAADKFQLQGYDVDGSAYVDVFQIDAGNDVTYEFNQNGADIDGRFEGDTDANLIYVDAGNDRVGIGTATPSTKLDVSGAVTATAMTLTGTLVADNAFGVQFEESSGNGDNYQAFRAADSLTSNVVLKWNITPSTCTSDGNNGVLTVNASNEIICDTDDGGAGGGGDNVTVNSTAVDTTANYLDNIYMDFDITDGGAGGPDDVTAKPSYDMTLAGNPALLVDECAFMKDTSGGGFICEGSTADTNEQIYRFPDANGADTDQDIVLDDATQTLTNKTINTASNTITVVEADISDLSHTATAITDGLIVEPDLDADNAASDGDILTYDSTGTNFAWITPNAGTDITADLEEEVTEGSLADDTITEAELKAVDTAVDEDILTYETTTGDFEWHTMDQMIANMSEGSLPNDSILEADLKAVDTASDEECLTYEVTTGDFEWQTCGSGAGTMTTVEDGDVQVGGADIVTLDFDGTSFAVTESPDTEINIDIADDGILEAHFKAVDAAADEECLTYESTTGDFEWQACGGGGGTGYFQLRPVGFSITGTIAVVGDATQGAQLDGSNGGAALFDATTDEGMAYRGMLPGDFSSWSSIKVFYSMTSATSGTVEFEAAIMCQSDGDSERDDADGFAAVAVASETVPGTVYYPSLVTITPTDDSCAANDLVTIFISTDADDGSNDTATGDRRVLGVLPAYTKS